nr:hypothetical protein [Nannocystis sp.]
MSTIEIALIVRATTGLRSAIVHDLPEDGNPSLVVSWPMMPLLVLVMAIGRRRRSLPFSRSACQVASRPADLSWTRRTVVAGAADQPSKVFDETARRFNERLEPGSNEPCVRNRVRSTTQEHDS